MRRVVVFVFAMSLACNRKHGDAYKMEIVAANGSRICAAMKDGSARCWGRDAEKRVTTPTLLANAANVVQVCAGDAFTCTRSRDGVTTCSDGVMLQNTANLSCGAKEACAIASGRVSCWSATEKPHEIPKTNAAISVAVGASRGCAIFDDTSVKCWRGSDDAVVIPNVSAKSLCVGESHACFVQHDETVVCLGRNDNGELGDGTTTTSETPKRVANVNIAQQIACGTHHTCARMGDSTVHCWGKNDVHQCGLSDETNLFTPTLVTGLYEAEAVTTGNDFTCVKMTDGWLRCFGVNDWGQLGDGTTDIRNVPTPIRY